MSDPILQEPESADHTRPENRTAPPRTIGKPALVRSSPGTGDEGGRAEPRTWALGQSATKSTVEEFFECLVEEIGDNDVRLRTRALSGEEGMAWLPLDRIPASERRHLMVGAPVRITILLNKDEKTVRREHDVRVLRPSQWRAPVSAEGLDRVTDLVLDRMRSLLR